MLTIKGSFKDYNDKSQIGFTPLSVGFGEFDVAEALYMGNRRCPC